MKRIVLTGGGTAGHVTPNLALVPRLRELSYDIQYIGSYDGIEKRLVEDAGIPYYGISSGKFRRYFDWKNFTDPFRVLKGFGEARKLLKALAPNVVFSKGGFVSVPVVAAAGGLHVPAILHESDMTPGLANKLCLPFAKKVCCNFPETLDALPKGKSVLTGCPIRAELRHGDRARGRALCGFSADKPVLLVMGGSLGSANVNQAIRRVLPTLRETFQVAHLCGQGKTDPSLQGTAGYAQFDYVEKELPDLLALADIVVSRAGANAICELLELRKPALLIPLGSNASRGDQIRNAQSFQRQGFSEMLTEDALTDESLLRAIRSLYQSRETYQKAMGQSGQRDAIAAITALIEAEARRDP